jgi:hypothetical protein
MPSRKEQLDKVKDGALQVSEIMETLLPDEKRKMEETLDKIQKQLSELQPAIDKLQQDDQHNKDNLKLSPDMDPTQQPVRLMADVAQMPSPDQPMAGGTTPRVPPPTPQAVTELQSPTSFPTPKPIPQYERSQLTSENGYNQSPNSTFTVVSSYCDSYNNNSQLPLGSVDDKPTPEPNEQPKRKFSDPTRIPSTRDGPRPEESK